MLRRSILSGFVLGAVFLAACRQDDQIQTYRVSKETDSTPPMATSSKEIEWKTPVGWAEQPPSAMRLGSFLIKGGNGQQADMSIVPLSGPAGGDLANINRWRGQINLGPISEAELPGNSETITSGGRRMLFVHFVSREPLIENRYKKSLMAAIYQQGERTWFFKMIGEEATVRAAKPAFLKFLQSLRFSTT